MACDVNCHRNSQLLFYVASATRQSGIYVWHCPVRLHTSIYVLYSTTTVLYVYFVPYVQYTVPVLSYYTNRVRPCHPICRLALLPVIFFVQLYSTVVLYTGIPYRLVLYISAFYVAQANEPVSIYAQNLRCTRNSMPLRDENDGTVTNGAAGLTLHPVLQRPLCRSEPAQGVRWRRT